MEAFETLPLSSKRLRNRFVSWKKILEYSAPALRVSALILADFAAAFVVSQCLLLLVVSTHSALGLGTSIRGELSALIAPNALAMGIAAIHLVAIGHYTQRPSIWCEARTLAFISLTASAVVVVWLFPATDIISRTFALVSWLMLPMWMLAFRHLAREGLSRAGLWQSPVLVLATNEQIGRVDEVINARRPRDFRIVKTLQVGDAADPVVPDWKPMLKQLGAERLVVAAPPATPGYDALIRSVVRGCVPFTVILNHDSLPVFGAHHTRMFRSDVVMVSYQFGLARSVSRRLKVVIDFCLAAGLIVVLAPLLICLTILTACDGGPVLFAHERLGRHGRSFRCLKFRTMATNGDQILRHTLTTNPYAAAEWVATRKLTKDPRVTRLGAIMRKYSLDELPQLFNVLRLEMSLVGPRPIVQEEVHKYAEDIAFYRATRPGLTGLWQVSGRSDTSYENRIAYDRWYVKNWTLWHDIVILMMTFPSVILRKGAR